MGPGADEGGFGEGGGFDHVAAALAGAEVEEGAADEDDGGEGVELAEFAHGVAEDYRG